MAALEGEARAAGAHLRYLVAWREKHEPKRHANMHTSPVVIVDIQPEFGV